MIELPTYTSVFRLRRRLYAVYDWELPLPVGIFEAGAFVFGVIVFALLGRLLEIELTPGSAWFYLVPPGFLAYLAGRPVADGKPPLQWVLSQGRYLIEPDRLHRLAEPAEPATVRLGAKVWMEHTP